LTEIEISDAKILEMLSNEIDFEKGFSCLIKKYQEKMYWHIRRMVHFHDDADDIIQNTFIKIFKNIKGFKAQSKLYTWIYRIAINETLSFIKKKKKMNASSLDENLSELEMHLTADSYFDGDKAQLALLKAIETLPERQKMVFNLRYYDELSYKDMSEVLDVSEGSLKASFHHAVKKVEEYLKQNESYV
jgi:RNA polymerase sigma-70 factor (ECF subfamily)